MTAVVMLSPGLPWPIWFAAFLLFVFAVIVIASDDTGRRRLTCGVLFALGLVGGPLAVSGYAVSVGSLICILFPFLLECIVL